MTAVIVLLSGPAAVGKSSVAEALLERRAFKKISSSGYLRAIAAKQSVFPSRRNLQQLGDRLDLETNYRWLAKDVARVQIANEGAQKRWLVDAVRKRQQIDIFRSNFPSVVHVHLTAPEEVLRSRFVARSLQHEGSSSASAYEQCIEHPNEQAARCLGSISDLEIDLSDVDPVNAAMIIADLVERLSCTE